jgi:predicted TIM-barrel fold metal-dependent hydrolase
MVTAIPSRSVDCHAHVFSANAPAVSGARYRPAHAAPLDAWQDRWRATGITHGVVVQPSFLGTDNTEMLAAIARDPAHLRGVAVVDARIPQATLDALHAGGVRAVRLNLRGVADWSPYRTPEWRALLDRVSRRGWHVEMYFDPGRAVDVAGVLPEAPLAVVLDHFAMPRGKNAAAEATFGAVKALAASRPVWCKLSAPYRLEGGDPQRFAQRLLETLGPDRLVWGSDWPWTNHEQSADYAMLREALDRWVGAQCAAAILWDNAARLYDLS